MEREPIGAYHTSRASGVRTVTACGDRVRGPGQRLTLLIGVFTDHVGGRLIGAQHVLGAQRGLHRLIEPGPARHSAKRARARATNPVDTGAPSSAAISVAVRSTGTLPSEPSRIAAAFTFGP